MFLELQEEFLLALGLHEVVPDLLEQFHEFGLLQPFGFLLELGLYQLLRVAVLHELGLDFGEGLLVLGLLGHGELLLDELGQENFELLHELQLGVVVEHLEFYDFVFIADDEVRFLFFKYEFESFFLLFILSFCI